MFRLKSHRKKQFVSGPIQGRLMVQIGVYWVLYHFFLWFALFVFRYADHRVTASMSGSSLSLQDLYGQFVRDYYPVVICALGSLPIVLIDMMKLTHRVAGPLVRVRQALRDVTAGKRIAPLKFRKGDLLVDLEDDFNKCFDKLSGSCSSDATPTGSADDIDELARDVSDLRHSVQDAVSRQSANHEATTACNGSGAEPPQSTSP